MAKASERKSGCGRAAALLLRGAARRAAALGLSAALACGLVPAAALAQDPGADGRPIAASSCVIVQAADAHGLAGEPVVASFGDSYLLSYASKAEAGKAAKRLSGTCALAATDGAMTAAAGKAADAQPAAYAEGADPFTLAEGAIEDKAAQERERERAAEEAQAAQDAAREARTEAERAREAADEAEKRAAAAQEAADVAAQARNEAREADMQASGSDEDRSPQPQDPETAEAANPADETAESPAPPEPEGGDGTTGTQASTLADEAETLEDKARAAREEAEELAGAAEAAEAEAKEAQDAAQEAQRAVAETAESEEEGQPATIAVIDSGAPKSGVDAAYDLTGLGEADESGHATEVIARIRERAPDARIISIRVLDAKDHGTVAATYAGIQLAAALGAEVVNLSLSAPAAQGPDAIAAAVADAAASGSLPVAAAGNDGADASAYTPANVPDAITVGACREDGGPLESSNWGPCVDLLAVADSTSLAAATASGWLAACDANDRESALQGEIGYGTFFPNVPTAAPEVENGAEGNAASSGEAPQAPVPGEAPAGKDAKAGDAATGGGKSGGGKGKSADAEGDERSVSAAGQAISAVKATEVRGVLDNGHSPDRTASAVGENQVRFEKGGQLPLRDATISYSGFKRKPSLATRNGCSLGEGAPYRRLGIWLPWDDSYYSSKGKSVPVPGKITMKWNNIATDMDGERLDLVLVLDNIKVACSDSAAKKASSFSILCNSESAQAAEGVLRASVACEYNSKWGKDQNPKVCAMFDLTSNLYKHGTTGNTASKYIMRIQDLDQPDRHKSSKSWSGDYVERIELLSGFDGTVWTQESIPATESAGGESWTNPAKARGASALNIVRSDGDIRASSELWGDNHSSYYRTGAVVRTAGGKAFKFRWAASAAETCLFQDYDGVIIRDRNDGERTTGGNRTDRAVITKTVDNYGLVTNNEGVAYDAGDATAQGGKRTSTKFRRTDEPWKGKATYHFSAKAGYRVSKVTLTSWITKPTEAKAKKSEYTSGARLKSLSFSGGASNALTRTDRNYDIVVRTAKVADATAALKAKKALTGKDLAANAFSIGLYKEKSATATPLQVKRNDASGNVAFDALSYTYSDAASYPQTHRYYLHEVAGADSRVRYDGTWWRADVTVSYDASFKPSAKVTYTNLSTNATAAAPTFKNTYTPAPATATITAGKRFQDTSGAALGQRAGMFKVGVYREKSAAAANLLKTLANTADGDFSYQVTVRPDDPAATVYWLHEIPGSDPSITYDGTWYQAVVSKSYDAATGALGASVAYRDADGRALGSAPTFVNERGDDPPDGYVAPAVWTPRATKTLSGGTLEAGEFAFALKLGGQTVQTAANGADGTVAFEPIEFGEDDANKTFHYTIEEVPGSAEGIVYDRRWWSADVSVFPIDGGSALGKTCTYAVHGAGEARPAAASTPYSPAPGQADGADGPDAPSFQNAQRKLVGARLAKADAATGAALAGAVFEIAPAADGVAVYGEDGQALPGSITVSSGADGVAATHPAALEAGRAYKVREVRPPEGYALSDSSWHAFTAGGEAPGAAPFTELGTWRDAPLAARATIAVRKVNVLSDGAGRALPVAVPEGGFAFELREGAPDGPAIGRVTVPASPDGISDACFEDIEYGYRDVGTHAYWIVEERQGEPGVDYAEPKRIVVDVAVETGQPEGAGNEGVATSRLVATVTEGTEA